MDAFSYANKLISYVADCYNKFGHYFPPAIRGYFKIHVLARRTISDLIVSCRRVGAFAPIRRVPIISPLQNINPRPIRKILVRPSLQKATSVLSLKGGPEARLLPLDLALSKYAGLISYDLDRNLNSIRSTGPFLEMNPVRHHLMKIRSQTHPIGLSRSERIGSILHSVPNSVAHSKYLMTNLGKEMKSVSYNTGSTLGSDRQLGSSGSITHGEDELSTQIMSTEEPVLHSMSGLGALTIPRAAKVNVADSIITTTAIHSIGNYIPTNFLASSSTAMNADKDFDGFHFIPAVSSLSSYSPVALATRAAAASAAASAGYGNFEVTSAAIRSINDYSPIVHATRAAAASAGYGNFEVTSAAIRSISDYSPIVHATRAAAAKNGATTLDVTHMPTIAPLDAARTLKENEVTNLNKHSRDTHNLWTHVSRLLSYLPVVDTVFKNAYGVIDDNIGSGLYRANALSKTLPMLADVLSLQHQDIRPTQLRSDLLEQKLRSSSRHIENAYSASDEIRRFDEISELTGDDSERSDLLKNIAGKTDPEIEKYYLQKDNLEEKLSEFGSLASSDITSKVSALPEDLLDIKGENHVSSILSSVANLRENLPNLHEVSGNIFRSQQSSLMKEAQERYMEIPQILNKHDMLLENLSKKSKLMEGGILSQLSDFPYMIPKYDQFSEFSKSFGTLASPLMTKARSAREDISHLLVNLQNKDFIQTSRFMSINAINDLIDGEDLSTYLQPVEAIAPSPDLLNSQPSVPFTSAATTVFRDLNKLKFLDTKALSKRSVSAAQNRVGIMMQRRQTPKVFSSGQETRRDSNLDVARNKSIHLPTGELTKSGHSKIDDSESNIVPEYMSDLTMNYQTKKPQMINRSSVRDFIHKAVIMDIARDQHDDNLSFLKDSDGGNIRNDELLLELNIELERILKDELRRYGLGT